MLCFAVLVSDLFLGNWELGNCPTYVSVTAFFPSIMGETDAIVFIVDSLTF